MMIRDKAKSTDVLSFPVNDFVKPGVFADDPSIEHVKHLGKHYCYYYERLI